MVRRFGWFLALVTLLAGRGSAVGAQVTAGNWQAQLYEPSAGMMVLVDNTGVVSDAYTLPLPAGFDHFPTTVASGHGGSPQAYVAFNSMTFQGVLVVSQRDRILASYALPPSFATSFEFLADESVFSEDNHRVAIGYSLDDAGWGILVLNTITGQADYSLRSDMPVVAPLGLASSAGVTPVIRQLNRQTLTFNLVLGSNENRYDLKTYDWQLDTTTLTANPVFTSLDSDVFRPTGDMIMTAVDNRLDNQRQTFAFAQANSLHVYEMRSGARFPFFNRADATLQSPRFIQNGERVLVDSATADGRYSWLVLERNGAVFGALPTAITLNEVRGVSDGFIYTTDTFADGARTLVAVDTRGGLNAGVPVWTSGAGEQPLLVWAGQATISAQALSTVYTAWAQLAEPVYAPGSVPFNAPTLNQPLVVSPAEVIPPEVTRSLTTVLRPGGRAAVHTTDGDQLNVRAGAGTAYLIVAKLGEGARVTIMDGPVAADGYTWWQVRTDSGIAGWVVESVENDGQRLQTLLPE